MSRFKKFVTAINQPAKPTRVWVSVLTSLVTIYGAHQRDKRHMDHEARITKLEKVRTQHTGVRNVNRGADPNHPAARMFGNEYNVKPEAELQDWVVGRLQSVVNAARSGTWRDDDVPYEAAHIRRYLKEHR